MSVFETDTICTQTQLNKMLIAHELNLLFIHIPRTGGTTITNIITEQLESKPIVLQQHANTKTSEGERLKHYPHLYKFGFVRNPWDRILSWYGLLCKGNNQKLTALEFEKFLIDSVTIYQNDNYFHFNQLDYFTDKNGVLQIDFIGRFENFSIDLKTVFEKISFPLDKIPINNPTEKKNYQVFYTDKSRAIITDLCAKDIAYFGYSFE